MHPGVVSGGQQESERLGVSGSWGFRLGQLAGRQLKRRGLGRPRGPKQGRRRPGRGPHTVPRKGLCQAVSSGVSGQGNDGQDQGVCWLAVVSGAHGESETTRYKFTFRFLAKDVFSVFSVFIHGLRERVVLEYELVVNDRGQPDSQCQSWGEKQRG